jgi:hypothetical protein
MKFRFTIRDLLWLLVVVALAVAWWADRREAAAYKAKVEAVWTSLDSWSGQPPSIDQMYEMLKKGEAAGKAALERAASK